MQNNFGKKNLGCDAIENGRAKYSEPISVFLKQMDQIQKDYDWAIQEEDRLDKLTQDYLHMLEMSELSYHDQARIAKYSKFLPKTVGIGYRKAIIDV